MFYNISWQSYWLSVALLITGYYLFVYLVYFRSDIKVNWKVKDRRASKLFLSDNAVNMKGDLLQNDLDESFALPYPETDENIVYAFIDELNAFLDESKRSKCIKEQLLSSIGLLLKKYPTLKDSAFKESVLNVIVTQCESVCSIHLKVEEVVHVWLWK
jgi:hypothetical protein